MKEQMFQQLDSIESVTEGGGFIEKGNNLKISCKNLLERSLRTKEHH